MSMEKIAQILSMCQGICFRLCIAGYGVYFLIIAILMV